MKKNIYLHSFIRLRTGENLNFVKKINKTRISFSVLLCFVAESDNLYKFAHFELIIAPEDK